MVPVEVEQADKRERAVPAFDHCPDRQQVEPARWCRKRQDVTGLGGRDVARGPPYGLAGRLRARQLVPDPARTAARLARMRGSASCQRRASAPLLITCRAWSRIEGTPGVGKSAFAMEAASILADQLVMPGRRWTFGWETQSGMQCPSDETAAGRAKQLWRRGRARGKLISKCNKGTCRAPTGHREPRILRRVKPEP